MTPIFLLNLIYGKSGRNDLLINSIRAFPQKESGKTALALLSASKSRITFYTTLKNKSEKNAQEEFRSS